MSNVGEAAGNAGNEPLEKKRRNQSIVWRCFKKVKNGNQITAVCNYCTDDRKTNFFLNKCGSTTHLLEHGKKFHPEMFSELKKLQQSPSQNNEPFATCLIRLMVENLLPIDNQLQQGLFNIIRKKMTEFDETSTPPITRKDVLQLYTTVETIIGLEIKQSINDMFIFASSAEIWKGRGDVSYLIMQLHCLNNEFEKKIITAKVEQLENFMKDVLNKSVTNILEQYCSNGKGHEKPRYVTLNYVGQSFIENESNCNILPCLSNTINDMMINAKVLSGFNDLLTNCEKIGKFFYWNDRARETLETAYSTLQLEREDILNADPKVDELWTKDFDLLVKFKKLKTPICHSLARLKYPESDYVFGCNWNIIEEVITIMEPAYDALFSLKDMEFPPLSIVIPTFFELTNSLAELADGKIHTEMASLFIDSLGASVEKYLNQISSTSVFVKSTILDPRYKVLLLDEVSAKRYMDELAAEIINYVSNETEDVISAATSVQEGDSATDSLLNKKPHWGFLNKKRKIRETTEPNSKASTISQQLRLYTFEATIDPDADPFLWWKTDGSKAYPYIFIAAKQYLQIPATSRSLERLLTKKRTMFEERRDSLPPHLIKEYIYLYENLGTLKEEIQLTKIDGL